MSFRGLQSRIFRRWTMVGLALMGSLAIGGAAEASTIYTYNFTQSYGTGSPIAISGSFSGTADSFDHISLGTLTDFHIEASSAYFSASYSGLPDFISYKIGDTAGTTLAIFSPLPNASYNPQPDICTGVATAVFCQTDGALGVIAILNSGTHAGVLATSLVAPTVTLVSAVSVDPVATTPIPGALLLFATGLGGLGTLSAWRRKSAAAPLPQTATA